MLTATGLRAIAVGLHESATHGVTTIGDIATIPTPAVSQPLPLRLAFQEVIGFSSARVESALFDLQQRIDTGRELSGCRSAPLVGISPHAPYTVHPQLLECLVEEALARKLPVAMHLAESAEELALLADGTGPFRELFEERSMWDSTAIPAGSKPLEYLRMLAQAPRALVVHGN